MRKMTKFLTILFCASWLCGVIVLIGHFPVHGEDCDPSSFSCPPALCNLKNVKENFCDRIKCVGINPKSCPEGSEYEEGVTMCNCCPGCRIYIDLGGKCQFTGQPSEISWEDCLGPICPIRTHKCRPGLECQGSDWTCKKPKDGIPIISECEYKRTLFKSGQLHWEPKCEANGEYSQIQCKGTFYDGLCFCANKDGKRIFGREWYNKAENQTCACSRKVHDLREQGNIATIHCSSDGNFEPLQCDLEAGLCYCVDTKTGTLNGAVVPENIWDTLPCYNRTFWGFDGHYLRQCESVWASWMKLIIEGKLHGLKEISAGDTSTCDYDGSFAPKQAKNNRDTCVYKNDQPMQYFELQGVLKDMDCQCARDTVLAREEGRPFTLRCKKENGNYAPTSFYKLEFVRCVDKDGYYFGPTEIPIRLECCLLGTCKAQTMKDECIHLGIDACASLHT